MTIDKAVKIMTIDKTVKKMTPMDKEEMQRLLFPNHSIEDMPYHWEELYKIYEEAVIILKEWNEAKETNKILAKPPAEIFNRVRIIPDLAVDIEDLEVILRSNGEVKDADKLKKVIDEHKQKFS